MNRDLENIDEYIIKNPSLALAESTVEYTMLRKNLNEMIEKLQEYQQKLNENDIALKNKEITDEEHNKVYREVWSEVVNIIKIKRELESRLMELLDNIKIAKELSKQQEEELKRQREMKKREIQRRSEAMVEWTALKSSFENIDRRRDEIDVELRKLDQLAKEDKISKDDYRAKRLEYLRELAQLQVVENEVKNRLSELISIISSG